MIKFEVCKGFEEAGINLPMRSTAHSVGYDFEAAEDIEIPSILDHFANPNPSGVFKPTLVKTGIKATFPEDVGLFLYNRSSNPGKRGLILANSVGVVECDYYGNEDNDGHVMFAFYNFCAHPVTIRKGDRIGQGVFQHFLITDDDNASGDRTGGFGSTNEEPTVFANSLNIGKESVIDLQQASQLTKEALKGLGITEEDAQ